MPSPHLVLFFLSAPSFFSVSSWPRSNPPPQSLPWRIVASINYHGGSSSGELPLILSRDNNYSLSRPVGWEMGSSAVGWDTFVDRAGDRSVYSHPPNAITRTSRDRATNGRIFKGGVIARFPAVPRRASARGTPAGLGASEIRRRHYTRPAL